jgi:hypothetical protein
MQSRNSYSIAPSIAFASIVLGVVIIDACAVRGHTETSVAESADPGTPHHAVWLRPTSSTSPTRS